jgi:hypothetical protein
VLPRVLPPVLPRVLPRVLQWALHWTLSANRVPLRKLVLEFEFIRRLRRFRRFDFGFLSWCRCAVVIRFRIPSSFLVSWCLYIEILSRNSGPARTLDIPYCGSILPSMSSAFENLDSELAQAVRHARESRKSELGIMKSWSGLSYFIRLTSYFFSREKQAGKQQQFGRTWPRSI